MHLTQAAHTKSHVFIGSCRQIIFHFATPTVNSGTTLEEVFAAQGRLNVTCALSIIADN